MKLLTPKLFLRLGLGIMYLYSGFDLIINPQHWYGFMPYRFSQLIISFMPIDTFLIIQGGGEIVLALILLAWFLPGWLVGLVGLLSSIELLLIIIFVGVDPITFRDIGLLGASLSVFATYFIIKGK